MAVVLAMGVPEDSPFRNPDQIPYLKPPPPIQNHTDAEKEEDTPSIRELVQEINSHAKLVDLEITSDLNAMSSSVQPQLPDPDAQPATDVTPAQPNQPCDPTT